MEAQDRLSGLDNTTQVGNVQTYSRFVRSVKIILPLCVLGVLGILFLWPQISRVETVPLNKSDLDALKQAETENTLLNAVFNTQDAKGRPVTIKADNAKQNRTDKDMVILVNPTAHLNTNSTGLEMKAGDGTYNQTSKILILNQDVEILDGDGNVLTTQGLEADITNGTAHSTKPATLTTDRGTITGQSVTIDREKQTTIFQGPAKAVINSQ